MLRTPKRALALAAVAASVMALARSARADDELRRLIREEIANHMAAQAASAPAAAPTPAGDAKSAGDAKPAADGNVFKVFWKEGLRLETKDKSVQLRLGGRLHIDTNFYGDSDLKDDDGIDLHDGIEFRRARLYNSGQIGRHFAYKIEFDFATGKVVFNDVFVEFNNLRKCFGCPAPNVRIGHFKEPFGRESPDSPNYAPFMELATSTEAFGQAFNTGIMLFDSLLGDRLNYGVGLFAGSTPGEEGVEGDVSWVDDGYGVSASVSYAPLWDCDCVCRRLFVGASITHRQDLDQVRFRARPGLHVTDTRLVDTGVLAGCDAYTTWGAHAIWSHGPWGIHAEYFSSSPDAPALRDPTFSGYYAYATYWLTGECNLYKNGAIARPQICCDFLDDECRCKGGVQLAVRYDHLDLTDALVVGGEQSIVTLGVNWWWNANARLMLNVLFGDVTDGRGTINSSYTAFGLGLRVDW